MNKITQARKLKSRIEPNKKLTNKKKWQQSNNLWRQADGGDDNISWVITNQPPPGE